MASREEIITAIKQATGDPDSGAVAEIIPSIADAITALLNPPRGCHTQQDRPGDTADESNRGNPLNTGQ